MGDIYIIHHDKMFLRRLLREVGKKSREIGLFINQDKTQISKLSHGFCFLKVRYNLTSVGRLIRRPHPKNITRQRRKLKSFKHFLSNRHMSFAEIHNETKAWLGDLYHLDCYQTRQNIRHLFWELFRRPILYNR